LSLCGCVWALTPGTIVLGTNGKWVCLGEDVPSLWEEDTSQAAADTAQAKPLLLVLLN
jgi:hypothetical protein